MPARDRVPAASTPARRGVSPPPGVDAELAVVAEAPAWASLEWIVSLEFQRVRDGEVTGGEVLDEHLAVAGARREDWERLEFLRQHLSFEHQPTLIAALAKTGRAGLVELLAWSSRKSSELSAALRAAKAGAKLAPAVDFALRRFVGEPKVASALARSADRYARSAGTRAWKREGEQAWRALFVSDARASGAAVATLLEQTWNFTNDGPRQQLAAAAARRSRSLTHAKACVKPLLAATGKGNHPDFVHSAVALAPKQARPLLEARWERYAEYGTNNVHTRLALGGLLALAPATAAYQEAAKAMLPQLLAKYQKDVGWQDVGWVEGLVMGIERGRIRALYPLLERVARWRFTGSVYDQHGPDLALLAGELVRRRARRVLDGGR